MILSFVCLIVYLIFIVYQQTQKATREETRLLLMTRSEMMMMIMMIIMSIKNKIITVWMTVVMTMTNKISGVTFLMSCDVKSTLCFVCLCSSEQKASAREDRCVQSVSLLSGSVPLQSHRERWSGCSVSPSPHLTLSLSLCLVFPECLTRTKHTCLCHHLIFKYEDLPLKILISCLFPSAGDRITVIDDSNEEWWRVSPRFVFSCWCQGDVSHPLQKLWNFTDRHPDGLTINQVDFGHNLGLGFLPQLDYLFVFFFFWARTIMCSVHVLEGRSDCQHCVKYLCSCKVSVNHESKSCSFASRRAVRQSWASSSQWFKR